MRFSAARRAVMASMDSPGSQPLMLRYARSHTCGSLGSDPTAAAIFTASVGVDGVFGEGCCDAFLGGPAGGDGLDGLARLAALDFAVRAVPHLRVVGVRSDS